jgi:hypothetical protein
MRAVRLLPGNMRTACRQDFLFIEWDLAPYRS